MRRLPPLNALRAFEAAGRHMSFTRAAQELNVTPAAVSHQIKALEEHLGVRLFRRLNRSLLLTDAGQLCLPGVRDAFEALAEAVARVPQAESRGIITVSCPPAFATKWLVPRVERFSAAHPDLDVRVAASLGLVDFMREEVDIAVRFGGGEYPGMRVDRLLSESVVPMCSPRLLDDGKALREPADLANVVLLHDDSLVRNPSAPDWRMWLKAAGADNVDATPGPHFSQSDHAMQAAIDGAGVVLGRFSLAAADLADRRLVVPFDLTLPVAFSYYVVCPEEIADRPRIAAFRRWLLAEVGADAAR